MFYKFYENLIDNSIWIYSIADYRQFVAYIRNMQNTIIDIANINTIYIWFSINQILSIRFIINYISI